MYRIVTYDIRNFCFSSHYDKKSAILNLSHPKKEKLDEYQKTEIWVTIKWKAIFLNFS